MVGDVADVVESVLDFPLSAYEGGCLWCGRLLGCEVGDVPRGFGGDDLVVEGAPFPVGANDLFGVGKQAGRGWGGGGPAAVDAAVPPIAGFVLRGKKTLGPGS
jgi:hypothetical protein